ncbi:MAG: peptide ABC transporter substrate-binding protein [Magnetococcales bacterium]|nr:peptide ABC transporter substrate-binding protein [Magnetococcales bacterium]
MSGPSVSLLAGLLILLPALLWGAGTEQAITVQPPGITIALDTEPPNLNSLRATDQVSFFILGHVGEGLLRHDQRHGLVGGVAESWSITADTARFTLRSDARWSDGRPVTAHDFVHAWRMALDPATASEYAFILYPIQHAREINHGQRPPTALGVRAPDDRTLEVTLAGPCGYFASLTAFATYFPVRADFHRARGERYAADAGDLLFNGPFRLARWVHGAHLRLEKNPHYWDRNSIRLHAIDIPYITTDPSTRFNLFRDGKIALTGLDADSLREAMRHRLRIRRFADGSVFFLEFNHRPERPTANRHLREAMRLVYDPEELVDKVIGVPGTLATFSLFPHWLRGLQGTFQEEYPAPVIPVDPIAARDHLRQALAELGLAHPPPLTLLTGDNPASARQAEYLQHLYAKRLGLELRIDKQTFKQRLARMTAGQFDLVTAGWGPDFDDPITFGDLFASWNANNRGRFVDQDYDHWVTVARDSADPRVRLPAFGRLQAILSREVAIIPQYERGLIYIQHPRLKGVVRRIFGADPDYSRAWVAESVVAE